MKQIQTWEGLRGQIPRHPSPETLRQTPSHSLQSYRDSWKVWAKVLRYHVFMTMVSRFCAQRIILKSLGNFKVGNLWKQQYSNPRIYKHILQKKNSKKYTDLNSQSHLSFINYRKEKIHYNSSKQILANQHSGALCPCTVHLLYRIGRRGKTHLVTCMKHSRWLGQTLTLL